MKKEGTGPAHGIRGGLSLAPGLGAGGGGGGGGSGWLAVGPPGVGVLSRDEDATGCESVEFCMSPDKGMGMVGVVGVWESTEGWVSIG